MMKEKEKLEYTKYERARIIGARALQISANAPILIKLDKAQLEAINYDPIRIAELEFQKGVLPITVRRPLPKRVEALPIKEVEIVKEEKELPKPEPAIETKAKVEEEAEREAEELELAEESVAAELEKAELEESFE